MEPSNASNSAAAGHQAIAVASEMKARSTPTKVATTRDAILAVITPAVYFLDCFYCSTSSDIFHFLLLKEEIFNHSGLLRQ